MPTLRKNVKPKNLKKPVKYASKPLEGSNSGSDVKMENVELSTERIDQEP